MHSRAKLLSLEQRRQLQLLNLMFIYKNRHRDVRRIQEQQMYTVSLGSVIIITSIKTVLFIRGHYYGILYL